MKSTKIYRFFLFIYKFSLLAVPLSVFMFVHETNGWGNVEGTLGLVFFFGILWFFIIIIPIKLLADFIWLIEKENSRYVPIDDEGVWR